MVSQSIQAGMLSVIIVNWNTCQDLVRCLASIYASPPSVAFEVLVVDNASADGSVERVAVEFPQVRLFANSENIGFAQANNRAAAMARGGYWLLLNPDTVLSPGAVDILVNYLAGQPRAAGVGPRLVNSDGSLQSSIQRLPTLLREWWRLFHLDALYPLSVYPHAVLAARCPQRVEVLNGACLLLRREAVEKMGLFDEEYFMYSEEIDLCDRLGREGWQLHWMPEAVVMHTGGQSTRQLADQMFLELYRNKLKFFRKRRGPVSGALYKGILLQATVARLLLAQTVYLFAPLRPEWHDVARQYCLLLAALPKL
jgi:N-acetylglucosaminyl-diphospho-decaprenol L-rhamnosyltransferase